MIFKRFLPFVPILLLTITGCSTTATFTRMTPQIQPRNANNLYHVEVGFNSKQQSIRWNSIQPYVLVNGQPMPMRPVPMVENRWEGFVPVPPNANSVTYRFKFDYLYNTFGGQPQKDSAWSPAYTLKVVNQ